MSASFLGSKGCRSILFPYLLFFCPFLLLFLWCHFLLIVHSPDLSPGNVLYICFLEMDLFRFVWLLLNSKEMIVGRWYVQLAAI